MEQKRFQDYFSEIEMKDIKKYMFQLLSSLENIHKHGIIHRDLKPDNFLYDIQNGKGMLIDFGLSEAVIY
jgi:cell division control protein 7